MVSGRLANSREALEGVRNEYASIQLLMLSDFTLELANIINALTLNVSWSQVRSSRKTQMTSGTLIIIDILFESSPE